MRKLFLLASVIVLCLAATAAQAKDTIKIGTEGAYPPFNRVNADGVLVGFDVDIAKALCDRMDAECEFVIQDWDGIIPGLLAKKYDAIVASMTMTDERREKVDFTNKYYQTPAKFMARKGSGFEITPSGLEGKIVGVQRATVHEKFVRDQFGDSVDVRSYATQDEANMDLAAGRLDLVIADSVVLLPFLESTEGQDFEFVGPGYTDSKWFGDGIGIALRKEDDKLRERFNEALAEILANGTYEKINAKYFDFNVYGE
ncbi:MAG: ABC transporter substrate-binding protein [Desulfovibrionales bacterium]